MLAFSPLNASLATLSATFAVVAYSVNCTDASNWRGKRGTPANILLAYQASTLAGNVWLAVAGSLAWFGSAPYGHIAANADGDRLFTSISYVNDALIEPLLAHFLIDLICYMAIPELREKPALIAHHVLAGALTCLAWHSSAYAHYYFIFFGGVVELSNIPLAFLEACQLVPELRKWTRTYLAARTIFSASFIALRLVCWPSVALDFWRDSFAAMDCVHTSTLTVLFFLASNAVLTVMQFAWGFMLGRSMIARGTAGKASKEESLVATSQISGRTFFGLLPIATMPYRLGQLVLLELTHPTLVALYKLSCFAYSFTGVLYWSLLPYLPTDFCTTSLMSSRLFAACLVAQGALSFINDAVCTFGYGPRLPISRGFWLAADRCCACSLTLNSIITAMAWSTSDQGNAPRVLVYALVFSFIS